MKVKVVSSEKIKLRGKENFITSLTTNVSYLSLLRCHIERETIRIIRPDGTRIELQASLDHVKPLDAPAFLTVAGAVDVPLGSEIEFSPTETASKRHGVDARPASLKVNVVGTGGEGKEKR